MITQVFSYISHSHELLKQLNANMSMSTTVKTVPSSIVKCNEIMMELFDFKSNLHEGMLFNSTFTSDMTEKDDEYFNEDLGKKDESLEKVQ